MRLCKLCCNPEARVLADVVAEAGSIIRIGPIMWGGQVQHHQDLMNAYAQTVSCIVCRAYRNRAAGKRDARHPCQKVPECVECVEYVHRPPPDSSNSASATERSERSASTAFACCP